MFRKIHRLFSRFYFSFVGGGDVPVTDQGLEVHYIILISLLLILCLIVIGISICMYLIRRKRHTQESETFCCLTNNWLATNVILALIIKPLVHVYIQVQYLNNCFLLGDFLGYEVGDIADKIHNPIPNNKMVFK